MVFTAQDRAIPVHRNLVTDAIEGLSGVHQVQPSEQVQPDYSLMGRLPVKTDELSVNVRCFVHCRLNVIC